MPFQLFYSLLLLFVTCDFSFSWVNPPSSSSSSFGARQLPQLTLLYAAKKGFAQKKNDASNKNNKNNSYSSNKRSSNKPNAFHKETSSRPIYSQPALYDLAFGYRDYEAQVDFLWQRHCHVTGRAPERLVEIAAGPARHALLALEMYGGVDSGTDDDATNNAPLLQCVHCIDASHDMYQYATDLAQHELSVDQQEQFHYHVADMRSFTLPSNEKVDTAWLLLGSLQHMNTNEDVRRCFTAIYNNLTPDGTLIIELPHPRETFSMVECTRNGWKVPLDDEQGAEAGELTIVWGDDDDAFDPMTQVRQFSVRMELTGTEQDMTLQEVVPLRLFTAQEIEALAAATNFRIVSMHGALELDDGELIDVNDEDLAYRMVVVLQKI